MYRVLHDDYRPLIFRLVVIDFRDRFSVFRFYLFFFFLRRETPSKTNSEFQRRNTLKSGKTSSIPGVLETTFRKYLSLYIQNPQSNGIRIKNSMNFFVFRC